MSAAPAPAVMPPRLACAASEQTSAVLRQACAASEQTSAVSRQALSLARAMRRLRRALQGCETCRGAACPLLDDFRLRVAEAVHTIFEELRHER